MWTLDLVKQQYSNRLSSPQKMWTLIVDLVKQQYSNRLSSPPQKMWTLHKSIHCRSSKDNNIPNRLSSPQKMWTLIVDLVKQQYPNRLLHCGPHCRSSKTTIFK